MDSSGLSNDCGHSVRHVGCPVCEVEAAIERCASVCDRELKALYGEPAAVIILRQVAKDIRALAKTGAPK